MIDKIPYWQFFKNYMVFLDGSIGTGFKLRGFDISCKSDEEINALAFRIETFLKSLDHSLKFQLYFEVNSDVSDTIEKHKNLSDQSDKTLSLINSYRFQNFESLSQRKEYYNTDIYLFVRSEPHRLKPKKLFESLSTFAKTLNLNEGEFYDKNIEKFKKLESSLMGLQLNPQELKEKDWRDLIYKSLNLSRLEDYGKTLSIHLNPGLFESSVTSQLLMTDHSFHKNGFVQGKNHFKILTLKNAPEESTFSSMIESLCQLPFHFRLVQNFSPLNQDKAKTKLELKRRVAHSMVTGSQKLSDIDSETQFSSIEELLRELSSGSEKLVSFDLNLIIWDEDEKVLDQKIDHAIKTFRLLNNSEAILETYGTEPAFLKTLPGVCEEFRKKIVKTSNLSDLQPLYEPWRGNEIPVCLMTTRDNSLFSLNPFEPTLSSWNGIVFGGSGSGKSFTVSQLMLMFYSTHIKPRIIWIDNGASSKQVVECLEGEYLDLSTESSFSLNLFDLPQGETKPTPEKVKLILAILEIIFKDEVNKFLPKREKALLEEAIFELYDTKSNPRLSDFRKRLKESPHQELKKYSDILFSWTGSTAYGKILDRPSNITLKKDITSIEMQSLNKHPELKDAVLLLLTSHIQDISTQDFSRNYLLIIDEAERLFKTEMAREFAITCYRTWRKFNSAVWSLSQNYKDFLSTEEIKDSLLPNINHLIILRQSKIDWKHFQEKFDFNDAQINAIKNLEILKRKHSDFYYQQGDKDIVLRLTPDALSYWICTTDPLDKMKILEWQKKYPDKNLIECLDTLAKETISDKEISMS